MNYYFHPAASEEYLDSVAFYESRLAGLGADYIAEFEATLKRICGAPMSYPLDCQPNNSKSWLSTISIQRVVSCCGRRSSGASRCSSSS